MAELDQRLDRGEVCRLAAPALLETFSVLTALPAPHRLSPTNARQLLDANFAGRFETVALAGSQYRALLQEAAGHGAAGGSVFDLLIAAIAREQGASAILTFNVKHFNRFVVAPMAVVLPGGP